MDDAERRQQFTIRDDDNEVLGHITLAKRQLADTVVRIGSRIFVPQQNIFREVKVIDIWLP